MSPKKVKAYNPRLLKSQRAKSVMRGYEAKGDASAYEDLGGKA